MVNTFRCFCDNSRCSECEYEQAYPNCEEAWLKDRDQRIKNELLEKMLREFTPCNKCERKGHCECEESMCGSIEEIDEWVRYYFVGSCSEEPCISIEDLKNFAEKMTDKEIDYDTFRHVYDEFGEREREWR